MPMAAVGYNPPISGSGAPYSVVPPVSGGPVRRITLSGLGGNARQWVDMMFRIKNASGGSLGWLPEINGSSASLHWARHGIQNPATAINDVGTGAFPFETAGGGNVDIVVSGNPKVYGTGFHRIFHVTVCVANAAGTSTFKQDATLTWANDSTEITSFGWDTNGGSNGIDNNSHAEAW